MNTAHDSSPSHRKSHTPAWRVLALCVAATLTIFDVRAAPVTVSASFNSYFGNVQSGVDPARPDTVYRSTINGVDVRPDRAIAGRESLFVAADPNDPASTASGRGHADITLGGTSSVRFGFATSDQGAAFVGQDQNLIEFTPGPAADVIAGQEFLLGTFTFENGNWFIDDRVHRFGLTLRTHSLDAALDGHLFVDTLELSITPNCFDAFCIATGSTPATNADQFRFVGRPALGAVSVYELADSPVPERNRGSVQLFGRIGSLDPTRFANASGGVILGAFTPQPPNNVPAPLSFTLLGTAAIALAVLRRRRREG